MYIIVCAPDVDNPRDGAPDTPDSHHGGVHHPSCGGGESCHLHTLDKQGANIKAMTVIDCMKLLSRL